MVKHSGTVLNLTSRGNIVSAGFEILRISNREVSIRLGCALGYASFVEVP